MTTITSASSPARRDQRERLIDGGILTMHALATTERVDPMPLRPERYDLLHHQADLQVRSRDRGEPLHRHLEPKRASGYALLPEPSPGDVFFDEPEPEEAHGPPKWMPDAPAELPAGGSR